MYDVKYRHLIEYYIIIPPAFYVDEIKGNKRYDLRFFTFRTMLEGYEWLQKSHTTKCHIQRFEGKNCFALCLKLSLAVEMNG